MLLAQDPYLEDEQKEALALVLIALAVNKAKARKGVRKARTVWVREWLLQRQHHGWYEKLMKHLEEGGVSSFKNFLSVDPEMFRKLVAHLNPRSKTLITGRPCPWFEGCYHSEVPCYRTLLQEPVLWFPCGSKHHCQYCPRGLPGHLWWVSWGCHQVSIFTRRVEGGGQGFFWEVELPSCLRCTGWEACQNYCTSRVRQCLLQLQELFFHHHASVSRCGL